MIKRPGENEHHPYFSRYISLVPEGNILNILESQTDELEELLSTLSEEDSLFSYDEGKWSIKELLGHLVDTERIFGYRALRIAREDSTELASYDENKFVNDANFNHQPLDNLIEQFKVARLNNILMFDSFDEESLTIIGNAGGNTISVRAIAYILAGHVFHHTNILKERYLPKL